MMNCEWRDQEMRPGLGSQESGFKWGLVIMLAVLYALFLNPRCWPQEEDSGPHAGRIQDSGRKSVFEIFRYQANPYSTPQDKLIALNGTGPRIPDSEFGQSNFINPKSAIVNRQGASPQTAGPRNADQVLLNVYDAVNGALKANATLAGGSTNPSPHNADQVFLAVYDSVNGAIRVNILAGGTAFQVNGTALSSSTTVNFQNSAATNGLTLTFTNTTAGNIQLGFTGTLNDAGITSAYSGVGACASNTWVSTLARNAAPSCTQPTFSNIGGTVAASQLPAPTASTLGGVESLSLPEGEFINQISTAGVPSGALPDCDPLNNSYCLTEWWLMGGTATGTIGQYLWSFAGSAGSPTVAYSQGNGSTAPLSFLIITSGAASSDSMLVYPSPYFLIPVGNLANWTSIESFKFAATSGVAYRVGWGVHTATTDGLYLRFDTSLETLTAATYSSGGTFTSSTGQTCNATFTGGTATGTLALTGTNTVAGSTAFTITSTGAGYGLSSPTSAVLGSGTATCSGTATVSPTLGSAGSGADTTMMVCNTQSSLETCYSTGVNPSTSVWHKLTIQGIAAADVGFTLDSGSQITFCASGCTVAITPTPNGIYPYLKVTSYTASTAEVLYAGPVRIKFTSTAF
jgi:hypothetical protein